jgi:hypothetical protein
MDRNKENPEVTSEAAVQICWYRRVPGSSHSECLIEGLSETRSSPNRLPLSGEQS